MAISYINIFKEILDKLLEVFKTEFKGSLPVYVGKEEMAGTQSLRIVPIRNVLLRYVLDAEDREFTLNLILAFKDINTTQRGLEQSLNVVSRIEGLVNKNKTLTTLNSEKLINCRIISTDISEFPDNGYEIIFIFKCQHTNIVR